MKIVLMFVKQSISLYKECKMIMSINDEIFCRLGHEQSGELLEELRKVENVNFQDETGISYLQVACGHHNTEAVRILLERGAVPNITDNRRHMPVFMAIGSRNDQNCNILELLLQQGLDLNKVRHDGVTVREMIRSFCNEDYNRLVEKYDK